MANISDIGKQVYESPKVARFYVRSNEISPPEQTILNLLDTKLPEMHMLDVGVGAGRTTKFFATKTKTYLGIDFSNSMIEACKSQFPKVDFRLADARSLPFFDLGQFDFVLFSFNGIDCLNIDDRKAVLSEMRRITSKDGFFCFSAHNINSVNRQLNFNLRKVLGTFGYEPLRYCLINSKNKKMLKELNQKGMVYFKDGSHGFDMENCYIRADEQIKQLTACGFTKMRIFDLSGNEISLEQANQSNDYWLYYLCQ